MTRFGKTLAALGGLLLVIGQAFADGNVSLAELGAITTAAGVVLGVYYAPPKIPKPEPFDWEDETDG